MSAADIDWQVVALNIRNSGLPLHRAAPLVEMDSATLNRIAREGGNPRWRQGVLLLDLHLDRCAEKHERLIAK